MAKIIDGKKISLELKEKLKDEIAEFKRKYKKEIGLAVVLVGDDPASQTYVKNKIKTSEYLGIKSYSYQLKKDATQEEVESLVKSLADNNDIVGILVQLPLPKHLNEKSILSLIPDEKDVDGFSPRNIGFLFMNQEKTVSCTPFGIIKLLEKINFKFEGKSAVVIGRSNTVGKPMAALLLNRNMTVTLCHSKTKNIKEFTKNADLVIAAVGKPKFLKADMVKKGSVVIDVGINRVKGKLVGDVDFENAETKASYITPVPGGVGPMTITMLMYNTLVLAKAREEK